MRYCCEECRKTFAKEEEALACEKKHKEDRVCANKKESERLARKKEVDEAYRKFVELSDKYDKDYSDYKKINFVSFEDILRSLVY